MIRKFRINVKDIINNTDNTIENVTNESFIILHNFFDEIKDNEIVFIRELKNKCLKFNKYGKNFTKEDMKHYTFNDDVLKCVGDGKYEKGDKENVVYYIRELSKHHDVYIMKENLMFKLDWIERNLKDIGYTKTIVVQNKHMIHADIVIDDYQNNIIGHTDKYRFLVDASYNRHVEDSDKIMRVKGLGDVLKYLEVL